MMLDICNIVSLAVVLIMAAIGLLRPKWISTAVLVARSFVSISLCYIQQTMLSGKDPVKEKMAYFKLANDYRSLIFLFYM